MGWKTRAASLDDAETTASRVFLDNRASRRLLASTGFREVGVYEKHGRLDGVWRDVVIVERIIDDNCIPKSGVWSLKSGV